MSQTITVAFGATIRHYRNLLKISQEQFADDCGFHRTYIGQIERGERNPSLKNIEIFAKTLKITLPELFTQCEIQKK